MQLTNANWDDGSCQENTSVGCGGTGVDADMDGICDDIDDCVGAYDACGICNSDTACRVVLMRMPATMKATRLTMVHACTPTSAASAAQV